MQNLKLVSRDLNVKTSMIESQKTENKSERPLQQDNDRAYYHWLTLNAREYMQIQGNCLMQMKIIVHMFLLTHHNHG